MAGLRGDSATTQVHSTEGTLIAVCVKRHFAIESKLIRRRVDLQNLQLLRCVFKVNGTGDHVVFLSQCSAIRSTFSGVRTESDVREGAESDGRFTEYFYWIYNCRAGGFMEHGRFRCYRIQAFRRIAPEASVLG